MFIENLPGVKTSFNFKSKYSSKNLLDMQEIFDRPNRKKLGYFWAGINSFNTKQTVKYKEGPFFFSGFYIENYEDAAISMGIFNRYIYLSGMERLLAWEKEYLSFRNYRLEDDPDDGIHSSIWAIFHEYMKETFNSFYIPFKRFLADKRPERCWVSFSDHDLSPNDPVYSDFLCGISSIELGNKDPFFDHKRWPLAIKEGPMGNPEVPLIELFLCSFPRCTKYAPEKIVDESELGHLQDLGDLGII
jgi:hypothetical protein